MRVRMPKKAKDKISKIIKDREEAKKREKKAKKAEVLRLKKIDRLRQIRTKELKCAADFIRLWISKFARTKAFGQIYALQKEIMLFVAHFWHGEPAPEKDITTCAALYLHIEPTRLIYRELHKGRPSYEITLFNYRDMISNLHPDFILQFAEALRAGKVWRYIESSLILA